MENVNDFYGWAETESLERWVSERENSKGKPKLSKLAGDPETDVFCLIALALTLVVATITLTGFALAGAAWTMPYFVTTGALVALPGLLCLGLGIGAVMTRVNDYSEYRNQKAEIKRRKGLNS